MKIKFITTGGTIDKVYFDAKGEYQVGSPQVAEILRDGRATFDYEVVSVLRKDSLEMSDADRQLIRRHIEGEVCSRLIVTHGTFSKALGFADLRASFLPLLLAGPVLIALAALRLKKQEA